jgi:hypothetical protein
MVVVPALTAVATPDLLTVATEGLLEVHTAEPVRLTVAPPEVVPMARNWPVWPGDVTDCEPGMIEMVLMSALGLPPPEPDCVTFTVIVPAIVPLNPDALAVMAMFEQTFPPEVISPVLLTVTHCGVALAQLT